MTWAFRGSRWSVVVGAALAAGLAGTYQYGWSVIRGPLGETTGAPGTTLGTLFTLLVVAQTLTGFPAGWVRDRRGPRLPFLCSALLLAAGFAGVALAPTFPALYLWFALGGAGVGVAYDVAINTPSRWFAGRRGMVTGAVSMGFSATSFLLIPLIGRGVETAFTPTLLVLAVLAGGGSLLAARVVRDPTGSREGPSSGSGGSTDDRPVRAPDDGTSAAVTWRSMVRDPRFWLLYVLFAVVNGVGLMLIEKVVAYAGRLGLSPTAAVAAASLVALGQASGVLVVGTVSDRVGRERVLGGSLALCGLALVACVVAGSRGFEWAFVACAGVTMFFRSPSFSVLSVLVGEYYGERYSSENYAVLLTAKLWGGVFGGTLTSLLVLSLGWSSTFLFTAALASATGVVALFSLR
ncbi:MFS transporter [Halomarina ordinaria]|uniref:MFS transporter n=1 Tax=Halomarina ordinaria TaxID=3033939 RepID=A0ABD5U6E2_9EURY|nr:MFS transporter [Halomarina sp. PSRA2]